MQLTFNHLRNLIQTFKLTVSHQIRIPTTVIRNVVNEGEKNLCKTSLIFHLKILQIWMLICILISATDAKVYKGEFKELVKADVSLLKEENIVKDASGFACHASRESATKVSCVHENICYALDISTISENSTPSNPVNCYVIKGKG